MGSDFGKVESFLIFSILGTKFKPNFIDFFLKKNQQFITWDVRAGHGSYFVTTYIQIEATWKKKRKIREESWKEREN